jgi:hypothetical protein
MKSMAQTHSETYRAFDIDVDVDVADSDGETVRVISLKIGIKGQNKRIPITPDAFTTADFATAEGAIEEALSLARRTIDRLLDANKG